MQLNDLQARMLDLLTELDDLLRRNDIEYMLYAGSQLGADRHRGMIPWDDDIDIMMSLENYDRFIELARHGLPEGRTVNALEFSYDYPLCYARYVDTTTTALQRHTIFGGIDPGVKIDVFLCVPTSSNEKKAVEHQMEILAFNEVILDNAIMEYRRPEQFFPYYEKEKKLFDKLGRYAYISKRLPELKYRYVSRFRKPGKYIFFSGMAGNSHFFDASEITNTREALFEGRRIKAAANAPYYNIESYGESWYQVPSNVSKPHHVWATDLSTPFSKHLENIGDFFDLEGLSKVLRERKELHLQDQLRFREAFITAARLKNLAVGLSVEKSYHDAGDVSLPELYELFRPFYSRQLIRENRWYGLSVPMDPEILSSAVRCLARMGQFAKAMDILQITGESEIRGISEIKEHIRLSRELFYAIYVYPDTLDEVLSRVSFSGDNLTLTEARGRLILQHMRAAVSGNERKICAEDLLALTSEGMTIFGECPELLILRAYAVRELSLLGMNTTGEDSGTIFRASLVNMVNAFNLQELIEEGIDIYEQSASDEEPPLYTSPSVDGIGITPSAYLIHNYVPRAEYDRVKALLPDLLRDHRDMDFAVKGKGDRERIIIYYRNVLASTVQSIVKKQADTMCYRVFWHPCADGSERVELKEMPVFAGNISPAEFLTAAETSGILNEENAAFYLEYRDWRKEKWTDINKVVDQYNEDFRNYMATMDSL